MQELETDTTTTTMIGLEVNAFRAVGRKSIIKRSEHIRFLGIILDENLASKNHTNTIENKIAKNVGALYRAKFLLNQKCLKNIYFAFINYGNIAWASTNYTKLTALNVYRLNIYQNTKQFFTKSILKKIKSLNHIYPTHHPKQNLVFPRFNLKSTRFSISYLWNRCLNSETKIRL